MNRCVLSLGLTLGLFVSGMAVAHAGPCDELSYRRNELYKRAGYCFKTAEQIRNFGNPGCMYDNMAEVPLSRAGREEVAEIVRREREMGCRY